MAADEICPPERRGFEPFILKSIIDRASDIYEDLHKRGQLISDADILIAATALEYGLMLSTKVLIHMQSQ
ncbi:MAG: hypothetical protein ACREXW_10025 [Gammaproteobacteria bacterium]